MVLTVLGRTVVIERRATYEEIQVKNEDFLGPDFFFVHGEWQTANRDRWAVWEQGGRYPDVIIELLSRKTAKRDRTEKKEIYRGVFHTSEYFLYDPIKKTLEGFRLVQNKYVPIEVDSHGRMWSEELELSVGVWDIAFYRFLTGLGVGIDVINKGDNRSVTGSYSAMGKRIRLSI